jgi:hypothetical protein
MGSIIQSTTLPVEKCDVLLKIIASFKQMESVTTCSPRSFGHKATSLLIANYVRVSEV